MNDLNGFVYDWLMEMSPLGRLPGWEDLHELWVDKIHDFVWEE